MRVVPDKETKTFQHPSKQHKYHVILKFPVIRKIMNPNLTLFT